MNFQKSVLKKKKIRSFHKTIIVVKQNKINKKPFLTKNFINCLLLSKTNKKKMSTHGKVRILHANKILLSWHIIKVEKGTSIGELFEWLIENYLPEVANQTISNIEARCAIMQDQKGDVVNMDCIASNIIDDFGKFLTYQIQYESFENPTRKNAFDIMKEAAAALYLPKLPLVKNPNSLDVLKQDVLDYIDLNKGGWKKNIIEKEAKDFVIDLSETLWFVDKCGPDTFS